MVRRNPRFEFKSTHELAEYLIELAEYLRSRPNVSIKPISKQSNVKESKSKKIEEIKEEFEKEIEGKTPKEIKEILLKKNKKELEVIARCFNISSTTAKNTRKNELVDIILDNVRFSEKFERLRRSKK